MIRASLRRRVLWGSFLASCLFIQSNAMAETDANQKMIRKTVETFMQEYQVPGVAVAVIDHGKSKVYVFGVADKGTKKPITPETLFEIGSVTKLFTTLLFAEKINQHQLNMNDKLTQYISLFADNKSLNQITLEQLATYTGSLPFTAPDSIKTELQLEDYLQTWQAPYPTGTAWQYSNLSIGLLGKVMQVQNKDYIEQLYQQAIFSPLKMTSTTITFSPEVKKALAQGYTEKGQAVEPNTTSLLPAAGAGKSNINDLSHFLAAAVGLPDTPKNIRLAMQIAQTPRATMGDVDLGFAWQLANINNKNLLGAPETMSMGPTPVQWLPVASQQYQPDMLIDKTGATNGFRAYIAVIPNTQSGIVILTNRYVSNGAIVDVGREILMNVIA